MEAFRLTAPCGLDCFNCVFYLAGESEQAGQTLDMYARLTGIPREILQCRGCRDQEGIIELHTLAFHRSRPEACRAFQCTRDKGVDFCFQCDDFPCDTLHPYADRADKVPHNTKVFNLCLIKKMGLEKWAAEKAGTVRETYFHGWWSL